MHTIVMLFASVELTSVAAPKQLVTLVMTTNGKTGCGPAKIEFIQALPAGSTSAEMFRIPDGRALVVTNVDWIYAGGPPGATRVLVVLIENLQDPSRRQAVFRSTIHLGSDGGGGTASRHGLPRLSSEPIASPLRVSGVELRGYVVGESE